MQATDDDDIDVLQEMLFNAIDDGELQTVIRIAGIHDELREKRLRGAEDGMTPLMQAIQATDPANPFATNANGLPIDELHTNRIRIIGRLITPTSVRVRSPLAPQMYPLHAAAKQNETWFPIIQMLLDAWAPVDDKDNNGNTPLYYAVAFRNIAAARLLLANGADINAENNFNRTPRGIAHERGEGEWRELIIDHDNNPLPASQGPEAGDTDLPQGPEAGGMDRPAGPGGTESIYDPHLVDSITRAIMERM
jgi:ankyrin repeat protein